MQQGPSESGFHFVQDYRNCKRYFYHKYVDDIESKDKPTAILFGIAAHRGLEEYYKLEKAGSLGLPQRIAKAVEAFKDEMQVLKQYYEYNDMFEADFARGQDLLREYGLTYSSDKWRIHSVESTLQHTFESGDIFTGRIDLVIVNEQGYLYVVDHKFTGWSIALFKKTQLTSDQATGYKLLWDSNNEQKVRGTIFNIIRSYKGQTDYDRVVVTKTPADVEEFEQDMQADLIEMRQRLMDPNGRWPKNTDQCFKFNRLCPYADICQGMKNWQSLIGLRLKYRDHQLGDE